MNAATLAERIAALPRVPLATLPTPLEEYPRLAARIGAGRLLVKRDDLTGLACGGNKVRELELLLGAARAEGADVLVAGGGVAQSNHARQCAAAARRAGMDAELILRRGASGTEPTGNLLVTRLLGARVHLVADDPGLEDREALATAMEELAGELRAAGRAPWVLRSSFHPLAAASYTQAALELAAQLDGLGIERAVLFCASMGATRIGLELAIDLLGLPWELRAVGWKPLDPGLPRRLAGLAAQTSELLGVEWAPGPERFATLDHGGPAYGVPSAECLEALRLAARTEGLLLDPVYTGKGFAGLRAELAGGRLDPAAPVVFLHTGGLPALFAYGETLIEGDER